ncbi:MAG: hypothetical protein J6T84_08775 [Spirochaetaceae bacterium]|nr:hypothetical protein [Spirochaetaceae bacterium]
MAKITAESRELFEKKSVAYKNEIKEIMKREKATLDAISKDKTGVGYKKLQLVEDMIYISTIYIAISNLSMEILAVRSEESLNEGRKTLYKAIIYLEEVVTNIIDAPYSDFEKNLEEIAETPVEKRYYLIRKLGLAIRLIMDAYGDNTKWKWSFVELNGRYTTVAKNVLDMNKAMKDYFDGRAEDHDVSVYYIRLLKKLLSKSADGYRERYELSTRRADDMRLGINYLIAYRRLLIVMGEKDEAEEIKKKIQVWKEKMEQDSKKQKDGKS